MTPAPRPCTHLRLTKRPLATVEQTPLYRVNCMACLVSWCVFGLEIVSEDQARKLLEHRAAPQYKRRTKPIGPAKGLHLVPKAEPVIDPDAISAAEVAKILHCEATHPYLLARKGKLSAQGPYGKPFSRKEVEAYKAAKYAEDDRPARILQLLYDRQPLKTAEVAFYLDHEGFPSPEYLSTWSREKVLRVLRALERDGKCVQKARLWYLVGDEEPFSTVAQATSMSRT